MYLGENMEYDFLLDDKRCKGTEGSIKTEPDSRLYSIEEEIVGNLLEEDELLDGSKELKQEFQDYNFPLTLDDTTDQMMHQTENHTVITPFSCDECVKSFVSSRLLTRHISKTGHVSRKRARCFLCSAILANKNVMRSHLCDIHWKLKPYKCKFCAHTSSRKVGIVNHRCTLSDTTKSEAIVIPDVINQILKYENYYKLHLGPLRLGKEIYTQENALDENCKQGKLMKDNVKNILKNVRNDNNFVKYGQRKHQRFQKKLKCFICNDIMMGQRGLRRHIWIHHLKLKPYKCRHCHFLSTSRFQIYRNHFKKAHSRDGNAGDVRDVEIVIEAVKTIEEFERTHKLNLGPSLDEELDIKNGKNCPNIELPVSSEFEGVDLNSKFSERDENLRCEVGEMQRKRIVGELRTNQKSRSKLECYICLSSFSNQESFEADQQKHSEHIKLTGPFQCPTCYIQFERQDINHHYETDHPELNAGCCLYCRAIIFRKKLRCHINNVHWAKHQLCNICGKSVSSGGMKDHVEGMSFKNYITFFYSRAIRFFNLLKYQ